jgi:pimeloyl-ACP methyl ester carboxylesterase
MARYIRDDQLREFNERVKAEVSRVGDLANDCHYVIYAIRDPTQVDRRKHPDGPPIYVGETKQMRVRADDHMQDGGRGYASSRCKSGLLKAIMERWVVPKFEILDTAPTHLTALIAETVWSRRFVYLGYNIANKWPEHRSSERPHGLRSIPLERMWRLTVEEAIKDEVRLELSCPTWSLHGRVDLETLRPTTPLRSIRSLKLQCPHCQKGLLRLIPPDAEHWAWKSYQPRPMPPRRTAT